MDNNLMINKLIAIILFIIMSPVFLFISILICISDGFPIIHLQKRIGYNNKEFNFFKFRTMKKNTPMVATDLLNNPEEHYIKYGKLIRELSLDEIPQLFNIIFGNMNFIGPRPALYNEDKLVSLRTEVGLHKLIPGITGWAQVNGRDNLTIDKKVEMDLYYAEKKHSFLFKSKILGLTIIRVFQRANISH